MKKALFALSLLVSQFSFAGDGVDTVQAIHGSAPGLTFAGVATGRGQTKDSNNSPCSLLYKNEGSFIKLNLIVENKVFEIDLSAYLMNYENAETAETTYADYNETQGAFTYSRDYGSMTNQYTGAHTYGLKLERRSDHSFSISYFHGWADDDGWTGQNSASCLLTTEK